jgi:hypothetical protein
MTRDVDIDERALRVTLELRLAAGSIAGRVVDAAGSARDFDGRLGLVAALDRAPTRHGHLNLEET